MTIVVLVVLIYKDNEYRQPIGWIGLLVAATAVFGIAIFLCGDILHDMRFLSAVSVFLLISMPVGTSTRFFFFLNSGVHIFMPIIFYALFEWTGKLYYKKVGAVIVGCMFLIICCNVINYRYGDTEQERQLVLSDPSNYFNGTITGKERQKSILELEYFFDEYNGDRSNMITLGDVPILHAVLNIPPFFPEVNGWTDLSQLDLNKIEKTFMKGTSSLIIVHWNEFFEGQPRMKGLRYTFFYELIETDYKEIYRNDEYIVYEYKR